MLWLILGLVVGLVVGWVVGVRYQRRRNPQTWFERPAAPLPAPRMPEPGDAWPTVQQALYGRTNLPGSTSKME